MKKYLIAFTCSALLAACTGAPKQESTTNGFIEDNITFAREQLGKEIGVIEASGKCLNPVTLKPDSTVFYCDYTDWRSGFFPGSIWYLYELSGDSTLLPLATKYTNAIEDTKNLTWHHDVGFMVNCSFGNGLRLAHIPGYKEVMIQTARSLSTRFRPVPGVIQSWDATRGWQAERGWECPVIIDNMMNLEFLSFMALNTGNNRFKEIADKHAKTTLSNHFRSDNSCYHVVSYDTITGIPHAKQTHQGYADNSSWARGQAWALYGYTMMYRETNNKVYLEQARKVALFIKNHPNLPEDKVPYWDFDAPDIPKAYRDASAAAIMASAFLELSSLDKSEDRIEWLKLGEQQIRSLSSPLYLAEPNTNGGFILKHSVGNFNKKSEVDVPLTYADYYYVEALLRLKRMQNEK